MPKNEQNGEVNPYALLNQNFDCEVYDRDVCLWKHSPDTGSQAGMLIDSSSNHESLGNLSNFTYDKLSPDAMAQRKAGLQKKLSQLAYDQDRVEMGSFGGDESIDVSHPVGSLGDSKKKFHFVHDQSPNKMKAKKSITGSPIDSNNNSIRNIIKVNSIDSTGANLKSYQLATQTSILETQNEDEDDNVDGLGGKVRLSEVPEEPSGFS